MKIQPKPFHLHDRTFSWDFSFTSVWQTIYSRVKPKRNHLLCRRRLVCDCVQNIDANETIVNLFDVKLSMDMHLRISLDTQNE